MSEGPKGLRSPRLWFIAGMTIFLFICVTVLFLTNATYARKETVSGWLVPERGAVTIASPRPSYVLSVLVEEGELVASGARLVKLGDAAELESGERPVDAIVAGLEASYSEVSEQLRLTQLQGESSIAELHIKLERLAGQRALLVRRLSSLVGVHEREHVKLEEYEQFLSEGLVARDAVDFVRSEFEDTSQTLEALRQDLARLDGERETLEADLATEPLEIERRVSQLREKLADLSRQKTQLANDREVYLSAPTSGIVSSVSIPNGSLVSPSETLLTIIPEGAKLSADVFVPPRAIGFIKNGLDVRIMYDPFPHERYGAAAGKVNSVSSATLKTDEIPTALEIPGPAYRARVELSEQNVQAFGEEFPLRAGMTFRAEIIQERRTLFAFLTEPIRARRSRS